MGLLTDYINSQREKQRDAEQAKIAAYSHVLTDPNAPAEGREYAFDQIMGMGKLKGKQHEGMGGMFKKLLGIGGGQQQAQQPKPMDEVPRVGPQQGASQGPPQVPPLPTPGGVPMNVAQRPSAQPAAQGPSVQDLAALPQQRLSIQPAAAPGPTLKYTAPPEAPEQPQGPPQLANLPQQVTRMEPSRAFRPIPPVPGTPEAGGGQPAAPLGHVPTARPRMVTGPQEQDDRAINLYKRQSDIDLARQTALEKTKEESGGLKSNLQRVVFKNPDGSLQRAHEDPRHPGRYFDSQGKPIAAPMPDVEVLTESELDRDDAAAVRKQEYEEKQAEKATKKQEREDHVSAVAEGIASGNQPPDLSRLYGMSAEVRAALQKKGYNLTQATQDWKATERWLSTLNSPVQLRMRQATEFAKESLDLIDNPEKPGEDLIGELGQHISRSKFKVFNKAAIAAAKNGLLGEEAAGAATRLDSQIRDLQSELATVYKGGNSPTDLGLKSAMDMLSSDWSDKVLRQAVDLARKNLSIRLNSIRQAGPVGTGATNAYMPQPGASPFAPPPPVPGTQPSGGAAPTVANAAAPAAPAAAPKAGKIVVISPEGVVGLLDPDKWEAAKARGFTKQ